MKYRADIDGLRAVAVWMVIIFHFFDTDSFNGYMGVDIFFVISGFLITNIIFRELQSNSFSILSFYERRARRILPALSIVLIVSAIIAYSIFVPADQLHFSKSLISTSLFVSNFLFCSEAGYFDISAMLKPLLHTWSLAIEEQFYIFFPILLAALYKFFKSKIVIAVALLCGISFILNIAFIHYGQQETAFFMLHTRAWELLIGALIALHSAKATPNEKTVRHLVIGGAIFIIIGAFISVEKDQFPGYFALFPVVGAGLLLYAGQFSNNSHIQKFLSHKYMVFMGKISYSLYLWHWALLVFVGYYWISELNTIMTVSLTGICVALSYLSWKFVEQPFRHKGFIKQQSKIFLLSLVSIAGFISIGSFYYSTIKAANPKSSGAETKQEYIPVKLDNYEETVLVFGENASTDNAQAKASIAVWGDSHAGAIAPAILEITQAKNKTGLRISKNDFLVPSTMCDTIKHIKECLKSTDNQLQYLVNHPNIKTVIIAHRWSAWVKGWQKKINNPQDALELRYDSLKYIIDELEQNGKKVILFMQVPEVKSIPMNQDIAAIIKRMKYSGRNLDIRPTMEHYNKYTADIKPIMDKIEKNTSAQVIWPHKFLCDENHCKVSAGKEVLYSDDDHLSKAGALYLAPFMEPFITP